MFLRMAVACIYLLTTEIAFVKFVPHVEHEHGQQTLSGQGLPMIKARQLNSRQVVHHSFRLQIWVWTHLQC